MDIKQELLCAGIQDNPDPEGIELFAELIVRRCAEIADMERDTSAGSGYITRTRGERILQEFGLG